MEPCGQCISMIISFVDPHNENTDPDRRLKIFVPNPTKLNSKYNLKMFKAEFDEWNFNQS